TQLISQSDFSFSIFLFFHSFYSYISVDSVINYLTFVISLSTNLGQNMVSEPEDQMEETGRHLQHRGRRL
ncbi:unnamed protein product, partial [Medioppia subpectinata]